MASIKFLVVLINERLTWKEHNAVIEIKVSENLGLLYRATRLQDTKQQ